MSNATVRVTKRKGILTIITYDCTNPTFAVTQVLMDPRVIKALKGKECDVSLTQESTEKFQSHLAEPTPAAPKAKK